MRNGMRTGWLTAAVCGGLMVAGVWTGSWGRTGSLAQEPTAEAENAAVAGTPTLALEESAAPATTPRQTPAGENPLAVLVEGEVESANGAITQFRFLNAAREAFEKLDADGSGQLEGEELLALREALGMRDRKAEALFKQLDTNEDGRVLRYEYKGEDEEFYRLDANGDGIITLSEMFRGKAAAPKKAAPAKPKAEPALSDVLFKEWDRDEDGQLSPDEFKGSREVFDRLDKNGDWYLSPAELRPSTSSSRSPVPATEPSAATPQSVPGAIAREDFKGPQSLFDQIDANKDGFLTPEELEQYRQSLLGEKAK